MADDLSRDHMSWLEKGERFKEEDKLSEAIECYEEAIKLKPDDAIAYKSKAIALSSLQRDLEALEYFDEAIKLKSDLAEAYCGKGAALLSICRKKETIELYKELKRNETETRDNYWIILEAIENFNEAIKLKPDYYEVYSYKGSALYSLHRNREAIECCNDAIKIKPDRAETYCIKADCLISIGRYTEAIECCDKAIEIQSNLAEAYLRKGDAFMYLRNHIEAIESYDKAIEINPNEADAYIGKGQSLRLLGRYSEAADCFDIAIKLQPDLASAYFNKGLVSMNLKNLVDAIKCFSTSIEIQPDNDMAYSYKGLVSMALGQGTDAVEYFNKAIKLRSDNSLRRARAYNERGQELEALQDFNQDCNLMQENNEEICHSGIFKGFNYHFNLKMSSDAIEQLLKFSQLQGIVINFREELQKLNDAAQDNREFKSMIKDEETSIIEKFAKIGGKLSYIMDLHFSSSREPHQEIWRIDDEFDDFKNEVNEKIETLKQNLNRYAIPVINPQIKKNLSLVWYHNTLFRKLQDARSEAEKIYTGTDIVIDSSNPNFIMKIMKLTSAERRLLSNVTTENKEKIKTDNIKKYAEKLLRILNINSSEFESFILQIAETVTLSNEVKVKDCRNNPEVDYWIKEGVINNWQDFFTENNPSHRESIILGCIDTLKILYAIMYDQNLNNLDPKEITNQFVTVTTAEIELKKPKSSGCNVFYIKKIEYKCYLLNEPSLLKDISIITSLCFSKVIDYCMELEQIGYNLAELDVETISSLIASLE